MNNRTMLAGLVAVVVLQAAVLAGEYLGAMYPLWTGEPVRLKTVPYDPRSLFRGNYARLRYEISSVPVADVGDDKRIRGGEVVYVLLEPGDDGVHGYAGASLTPPASGTYLRGRVTSHRSDDLRVRYGIEAYFAPEHKALDLEDRLRRGGVAEIMLASNGKARLTEVVKAPGEPAAQP